MSELDDLARDFDEAAREVPKGTRQVIAKGALNVKTAWRKRWHGLTNAPSLEYAVTYDSWNTPYGAAAEIGPDKDKKQGALGNIIEYGSVNNLPHPGGLPSAEEEEPRLAKALEDLGFRAANG